MLIIPCPWCGARDEHEFQINGDASGVRPAEDAPTDAFYDHVYSRSNPRGWHIEWWQHVGGCRQWLKVVRHTQSHRIHGVYSATETPVLPVEDAA